MAKKKFKPMDQETIFSHVSQWLTDAYDFNNTELAHQRSEALRYYMGEPLGNEKRGKSQVVTRDVAETIDWIMPSLMKVFHSGGQVVKYNPETAADVPMAEQETEYINYLFNRKNDGFKIMHDWFQDALMMKTGIAKVYVEDVPHPTFDFFTGLTEDQAAEIIAEPSVELLARTVNDDGTWDIKIRKDDNKREIKVCVVPPEQFIIDRRATSIDDAQFVAHREEKTISDLRAMGVSEEILETLPFDEWEFADSTPEKLTRDNFDASGVYNLPTGSDQEANRKVWVNECYVNIDADGDGFAELRRIVLAGDHILFDEEWDCKPFADITPHRIAHKFFGMSIYDKIKDIQEIRSVLYRNVLDNIYRTNTGRFAVVEGQVNLEDLISNEQSGIVRMKSLNTLQPIDTPQLSPEAYNMIDRLEADRGKRTGVTQRSQGLDENTLHSNQAATSVNQMMTAAEQQIDLIARMFAETGVKRLFQLLHDHAIKYQDQKEVFELRGQYIEVNPSNWRQRTSLSVTVGIGNMNKDQQLIHLTRMFEMAQTVVAGGGMGILISEQNIYNILKEMAENAGYKEVTKYWTDPSSPEAQQAAQQRAEAEAKPKPDEIKAQADMQRAQSDAQDKMAEAQMKQIDAQVKMAQIELDKQRATVELRQIALQEAQLELERQKFTWQRARDEAEFVLEQEQQRAAALGDGHVPVTKKAPRKVPAKKATV